MEKFFSEEILKNLEGVIASEDFAVCNIKQFINLLCNKYEWSIKSGDRYAAKVFEDELRDYFRRMIVVPSITRKVAVTESLYVDLKEMILAREHLIKKGFSGLISSPTPSSRDAERFSALKKGKYKTLFTSIAQYDWASKNMTLNPPVETVFPYEITHLQHDIIVAKIHATYMRTGNL